MAAPVKAKKDKSTSKHEQATHMLKESTEEITPPNKKKAKQSPIMAKMLSGLNIHGAIDVMIPNDDEESIQQTCVM